MTDSQSRNIKLTGLKVMLNDNEIALMAKTSMIHKKYITNDPFTSLMYGRVVSKQFVYKQPIINRGTYTRYQCIEIIANKLLTMNYRDYDSNNFQILQLGIGFDTSGIKMINQFKLNAPRIFEVDLPSVISSKLAIILSTPELMDALAPSPVVPREPIQGVPNEPSSLPLKSDEYRVNGFDNCAKIGKLSLIGCDLKNSDDIIKALCAMGFEMDKPTLVITECVLVYLHDIDTVHLIQKLSSHLKYGVWLSYDMLNPNDSFGKVMYRNITHAGFQLPGFISFPTLESQRDRFTANGFDIANSCSMLQAYNNIISKEEKQRVSRLELLDEIEEWELLMNHYSLSIAVKGPEDFTNFILSLNLLALP